MSKTISQMHKRAKTAVAVANDNISVNCCERTERNKTLAGDFMRQRRQFGQNKKTLI